MVGSAIDLWAQRKKERDRVEHKALSVCLSVGRQEPERVCEPQGLPGRTASSAGQEAH